MAHVQLVYQDLQVNLSLSYLTPIKKKRRKQNNQNKQLPNQNNNKPPQANKTPKHN